ncbi:MAG: M14 family metallocarboxypeptidase [Defluviitaleaceae bacterium]|nr:M14 family metallocarboxypeptidase [Defluviitaleaceae bacterium]
MYEAHPITSARLTQAIDRHVARFPFVRVSTIGKSRLGRPIYALVVGHGKKAVLINAAHHANEWITSNLAMAFVEDCAAAQNAAWMDRVTLHMVPMVNPDGVDLVTGGLDTCSPAYQNARAMAGEAPFPDGWKANIAGVDLNSNYPAGWELAKAHKFEKGYTAPGPRDYVGAFPLCQPESAAMAAYTMANDFAHTISLHTQGEVIFWQYQNFDPPGAKALARRLSAASGYPLDDVPDTSSHAGYRDWFIEKFNRPGMTVECGLGENPLPLYDFGDIYKKVAPLLWEAVDWDAS